MGQLIQERVIVKKAEGGYAWVSAVDGSGCGSCSSKNVCGSANLLKPLLDAKSRGNNLKVRNTLNAKVGDQVILELSSSALLKGTFLTYLFPLATLLLFALPGRFLLGETASVLLGIAGLFAGLYLVKIIITASSFKDTLEPQMVSHETPQEKHSIYTIQP